jgi:hypothetical protein
MIWEPGAFFGHHLKFWEDFHDDGARGDGDLDLESAHFQSEHSVLEKKKALERLRVVYEGLCPGPGSRRIS